MAFSFFFRDLPTLETAAKNMIANTLGRSRVRVWVAGCAMGQEVYSLAIILAENMGYFGFQNLTIDATDIEADFRPIIERGIYSRGDLERIPHQYFEKYFHPTEDPEKFQVVDRLRERVTFHLHDLLSLEPITEGLSLIICKNVLLHFQPEERVEVFRMFHRALAPGGYLANENTQKLPPEVSSLFIQIAPDTQVYKANELSRQA